jgi:hypothetical protein
MRRFLGYDEIQLLNWRNRHAQGIFYETRKYKFHLENCSAPAPSPSSHFDPPNEVKERLHRSALQCLSGLTKALALFLLDGGDQWKT